MFLTDQRVTPAGSSRTVSTAVLAAEVLQDDVAALQREMRRQVAELGEVQAAAARSTGTLAALDGVKIRMEAACSTLKARRPLCAPPASQRPSGGSPSIASHRGAGGRRFVQFSPILRVHHVAEQRCGALSAHACGNAQTGAGGPIRVLPFGRNWGESHETENQRQRD